MISEEVIKKKTELLEQKYFNFKQELYIYIIKKKRKITIFMLF